MRLLKDLMRDKEFGQRIVPIIPDEARTFGMEALFRQVGIYSHAGQVYEPVDMDTLLYYKEASDGQILEEGITEAGAAASFQAAIARGVDSIMTAHMTVPALEPDELPATVSRRVLTESHVVIGRIPGVQLLLDHHTVSRRPRQRTGLLPAPGDDNALVARRSVAARCASAWTGSTAPRPSGPRRRAS